MPKSALTWTASAASSAMKAMERVALRRTWRRHEMLMMMRRLEEEEEEAPGLATVLFSPALAWRRWELSGPEVEERRPSSLRCQPPSTSHQSLAVLDALVAMDASVAASAAAAVDRLLLLPPLPL